MGPTCHHSVLIREKQREIRETQRGDGDAKTEAEVGVVLPHVKEWWQPTDAEDARMDSPWSL